MRAATEVAKSHLEELREGTFPHALIDALAEQQPELFAAFEGLGAAAKSEVYTDERVLQVEYAGFKVIGGLLDELMNALPVDLGGQRQAECFGREAAQAVSPQVPTSAL